ncbi:uncharacterized protein LOC119579124 [Penaeus monodon]|uniref:uncharacterized protein LOC119579124 n=1 Tax=Penaeus monodon TaxID=6687 RepID=UPI0018A7D656|nr:uncharacterized protein LOC119579124 [Penaeus monodon]
MRGKMSWRFCVPAILLVGVNLVLVTILQPSWTNPPLRQAPAVVLGEAEHPALTRKCFSYSGVKAENICCKMHWYKHEGDILECVRRANVEALVSRRAGSPSLPPEPDDVAFLTGKVDWAFPEEPSPDRLIDAAHWVIIGDSYMRYLFDVIARRASGPGLQYRMSETKGGWAPAALLLNALRNRTIHEDIEVRHLAAPFRITYYTDFLLKRLPELIKQWELEPHLKPSVVVMGTGLHWMRAAKTTYAESGPDAAMTNVTKYFRSLVPHLSRLAKTAPTIFKLLDDVQDSHLTENPEYSAEIFRRYNSLFRESLRDTGVFVWDSNLPLSEAYTKECLVTNAITYDFRWRCFDHIHAGYIVQEQFGDMVFNFICNKHLNLPSDYCT